MDNNDDNIDQYGLYNSSQYEIEEIMGTVLERTSDKELGQSEYLYEDETACDLSLPQNYDIEDIYLVSPNDGENTQDAFATAIRPTKRQKSLVEDMYLVPPNDGKNTQDDFATAIRQTKKQKPVVENIYDEDHYSLARNSGFPISFSKLLADDERNTEDELDTQ